MKKGLLLTLVLAAFAMAQATDTYAEAPTISNPADIIIGDTGPATSGASGTNIFVFPDAIDVRPLVREAATSLTLKWSFGEASLAIEINAVVSNSGDVVNPANAAQLNLNDGDDGEPPDDASDSEPLTLTFRNVLDLAGGAGNVDTFDDLTTQTLDMRTVTSGHTASARVRHACAAALPT